MLARPELFDNEPDHLVALYGDDEQSLVRNVGTFLREGLRSNSGLLVVATPEHQEAFLRQVRSAGADVSSLFLDERLAVLDAERTLDQLMDGRQPSAERFHTIVGNQVRRMQAHPGNTGLRIYGEMVGILWCRRQFTAAIRLEQLWNNLLKSVACKLFCAYPIDVLSDAHAIALDGVLCSHAKLVSSDSTGSLDRAIDRAMNDILGPRVGEMRSMMQANYSPNWATMPRAEATIFWLRQNLPEYSQPIMDRIRHHLAPA